MRTTYFIIALILIGETCFRLVPKSDSKIDPSPPTYDLFLLSDNEVSVLNYVYYLFEYVKVLGLALCLYIEKTRYKFVVILFGIDLLVYLLNYSSTLTYIGGFPIGMDVIKLGIFGVVIIREALNYHRNGHYTDTVNRRSLSVDSAERGDRSIRPFTFPKSFFAPKIDNQKDQ
jgi:hypothetical protein